MSKSKYQIDPVFTPELIKILKIFGFISISLVLILSLFNTKRANNTGKDLQFRMAASSRIYFLNIRSIHYDREIRSDARMTLFRHSKREKSDSLPLLDLVLILNPQADEAYLYLEPLRIDWPVELRVTNKSDVQFYSFANGNKSELLDYAKTLKPLIAENTKIELKVNEKWIEIWKDPKAKDALLTTIEDYHILTETDD